ncbi:hypothetical protein EMGBS15_08000 [Filimonas sp.]|jgi:hypothetical protein|nr:hypothetical protein EMGBS15_08000 [Filimonas sp.]
MQLYAKLQLITDQMLARITILLFFFLSIPCWSIGQKNENSSEEKTEKKKVKILGDKMFNFDILAGIDFPQADMAKRFGTSYRLGLGIKYKTAGNWIFGVKGELILGNRMREDSLLINMKTSQGGVISQLGDVLNVGTFERGYLLGVQVGRIFPVFQVNKNSGLTSVFSAGFMQHKIKLFDKDNSFPQFRDSYYKGYDRLTNGGYIENYTGYTYHATNKLINISVGVDAVWGFTRGRRDYLYDVARKDDKKRNDVLIGFKLGWIVPIYKKLAEETYY